MRIIAGQWRGRRIDAPKGEGTRPTIDRVRESLMSVIGSARGGFEGAVVLDAFAGSGALGLEALSRGASSAVFYERDRAAQRALEANIARCGADAHTAVVRKADVIARPPASARPPFDLLLLDPPYETDPVRVFAMIDAIARGGALAPGAVLSYEHDAIADVERAAAASEVSWRTAAAKTYGKVRVHVFVAEEDGAPSHADGEAQAGADAPYAAAHDNGGDPA